MFVMRWIMGWGWELFEGIVWDTVGSRGFVFEVSDFCDHIFGSYDFFAGWSDASCVMVV